MRSALSLTLRLGFGAGKAAGAALSYLLRTTFSTAADQSFINGQVLDTEAEGMLDGSLTIVGQGTSTQEINNGTLLITRPGAPAWGQSGATQQITSANGRLFYSSTQSVLEGNYQLGFRQDTDSNGSSGDHMFYFIGTDLYVLEKANSTVLLLDANIGATAGTQEVIIIQSTTGAFYYIKNAKYPTWTLLRISENAPLANVYGGYEQSSGQWRTNKFLIPDTLYTEQITPDFTLTNETATDTYADFYESGTFTAVTGQTLQFDYRRSLDGQDCWRLKVAQGSSNNVTLHKVVAGAESAALSTASSAISNGLSYSLKVNSRGDSYHASWIDDVAKTIYTTTDTHQESVPGVKLDLGTISTVSLGIYQGNGYTFAGIG